MLNSEDQQRLTQAIQDSENGTLDTADVIWAVDQLRKADETCRNLVNAIAFWRNVLKQAL